MSSPSQTYTPAQYLDAGFRAEMAGDRERASQYYIYLADTFPDSVEGEAARGGLMRIGFGPRGQPASEAVERGPVQPRPAAGAAGSGTPHGYDGYQTGGHGGAASHGRTPTSAAGATVARGRPANAPANAPAGASRAATETGTPRIKLGELSRLDLKESTQHPAPRPRPDTSRRDARAEELATDNDDSMRLPEVVARRARELSEGHEDFVFKPGYRGARKLAHVVAWLGRLVAAGGMALLVFAIVGIPVPMAGATVGIFSGYMLGGVSVVMGLALALGGQVALAIFDNADTMRELTAVVRARAEL